MRCTKSNNQKIYLFFDSYWKPFLMIFLSTLSLPLLKLFNSLLAKIKNKKSKLEKISLPYLFNSLSTWIKNPLAGKSLYLFPTFCQQGSPKWPKNVHPQQRWFIIFYTTFGNLQNPPFSHDLTPHPNANIKTISYFLDQTGLS